MSMDFTSPQASNETRIRLRKYFLDKLDSYAQKSHLWQILHASHIHRNLLKKSRHLSKIHSISEDIVRQCIHQFLNDLDEYVHQLNHLFSSHKFDQIIWAFKHEEDNPCTWHQIQIKRAKILFPSQSTTMSNQDLLEHYYQFVQDKFRRQPSRPSSSSSPPSSSSSVNELIDQLNSTYNQDEMKAKEFIRNFYLRNHDKCFPSIEIIDEILKLGFYDMKKIPTREDFSQLNGFFARLKMFHRAKESYRCVLQNTTDDFLLLRFGRAFGSKSSSLFHKEYFYLLHGFLKSLLTLFLLLTTTSEDEEMISISISKLNQFIYPDDETSINKISLDLFSPLIHIDQWTWLFEQWRQVLRTMPLFLTENGSFTRLVRTTIGIGMMKLGDMAENVLQRKENPLSSEQINEEFFHSLQIGFYFGISYAVVDSLQDQIEEFDLTSLKDFLRSKSNLDSSLTSTQILDEYFQRVEQSLLGKEFHREDFPSTPFTDMLIESFDNLRCLTSRNGTEEKSFFELSLLLRAQRRDKKSFEDIFDEEQIVLGPILKSHYTYRCASHLGQMSSARNETDRMWSIPFLGQLTDDCRDFPDDLKLRSLTPFTYFHSLFEKSDRKHLCSAKRNPFYLFLNLCSEIYLSNHRDQRTGAFLGRRILRALKSIEIIGNTDSYRKFVDVFTFDNSNLHDYFLNKIYRQFPQINDPEKRFFRSLDHLAAQYSKTNRKLETFIFENNSFVDKSLKISPMNVSSVVFDEENLLISAMNYSIESGGKRLRMFLLLILSQLYGIDRERILPLACGIEYLHTSSLIFDDLPAQDNSDLRRGHLTLHKTILNNDIHRNLCEARAQLAAVDLISFSMKKINDGLVHQGFPYDKVNRIIGEIAHLMHCLCVGQMMDLISSKKYRNPTSISSTIDLDYLDRIAWFKTGKTIEAVMISPAILSSLSSDRLNNELIHLRELSRLLGILFQMKDDLLDLESTNQTGKPSQIDSNNETTTYLTLIGKEQTEERLNDFLRQTFYLIDQIWKTNAETLKDVVKHLVQRKY